MLQWWWWSQITNSNISVFTAFFVFCCSAKTLTVILIKVCYITWLNQLMKCGKTREIHQSTVGWCRISWKNENKSFQLFSSCRWCNNRFSITWFLQTIESANGNLKYKTQWSTCSCGCDSIENSDVLCKLLAAYYIFMILKVTGIQLCWFL